jgi:hypothetical protein
MGCTTSFFIAISAYGSTLLVKMSIMRQAPPSAQQCPRRLDAMAWGGFGGHGLGTVSLQQSLSLPWMPRCEFNKERSRWPEQHRRPSGAQGRPTGARVPFSL